MNTVMTLGKGIFRVLFVLLVQSAIWSIHVCKPLNKAEILPWDDDQFRPNFSKNSIWPTAFAPPVVRPTFEPPVRTHRHFGFYGKHKTKVDIPIGLRILILVLIGITGFIACLCKYACKTDENTSESTSAIVHTPPTRISPTNLNRPTHQPRNVAMPTHAGTSSNLSGIIQQHRNVAMTTDAGASNILSRNALQFQNGIVPVLNTETSHATYLSRNTQRLRNVAMPIDAGTSNNLSRIIQQHRNVAMTTDAGASNILQFQNGIVPVLNTEASYTNNVTDQPPSYSDVVVSDLTGGTLTFPNVSVTIQNESPPPKYEKGDLL